MSICDRCGEVTDTVYSVGKTFDYVCFDCKQGKCRCLDCRRLFRNAASGCRVVNQFRDGWFCWTCLGIDEDRPPKEEEEEEENHYGKEAWHWLYNCTEKHLPEIKIVKQTPIWQVCTVVFEEINEGDEDYIDISA